mgnify:CR=1 FL=1
MPSLTRNIPHGSDAANKILSEIRWRIKASETKLTDKHKEWKEAEDKTLAYLPEREVDVARRAEREGGKPAYTTIQIPYSYAVLMAAHTYLTSVFLPRSPIFQYTGRHGESMQKVQAMEALIDYQVLVGKMVVPLYIWLYDAGKYGAGIIGLYWDERYENVSNIQMEKELDILGNETGKIIKKQKTVQVKTYQGNRIYNIQPWDFLWDVRRPLRDFQKGEYCATKIYIGWNDVKRRESLGYYINTEHIRASQPGGSSVDGSVELTRPESTDPSTASNWYNNKDINQSPQALSGYECYIELIPKDWGLGESDFPEKWVFTCTQDFKVLVGAQPLGALHAQFPFNVLPLDCEGYGLITRGYPKVLEPVQNTVDWLINSHFYNVRAALNNRVVVDPSRVVMKDVLDPLPGGAIRLRPEAYGTDTRLAVTQLQIQDVTQNHLRDFQVMLGVGERTVGINDQIMGMLNGGGRKTATEVRTSTSFGVNRLKTTAEWFSAVGFDPLSQMLVQNTQQHYDQTQQFKIAGDLLQTGGSQFIQVTPDVIGGFFDFVPVDGTLPIDRFAQVSLWQNLFAQIRNFPELRMGYDLGRIFEYVAQIAGLKNITQFKVQVTPDRVLQMQAMEGNAIPVKPGAKTTPPGTTGANSSQIAGMGVAG